MYTNILTQNQVGWGKENKLSIPTPVNPPPREKGLKLELLNRESTKPATKLPAAYPNMIHP